MKSIHFSAGDACAGMVMLLATEHLVDGGQNGCFLFGGFRGLGLRANACELQEVLDKFPLALTLQGVGCETHVNFTEGLYS